MRRGRSIRRFKRTVHRMKRINRVPRGGYSL